MCVSDLVPPRSRKGTWLQEDGTSLPRPSTHEQAVEARPPDASQALFTTPDQLIHVI